jgi:hypothetical protein
MSKPSNWCRSRLSPTWSMVFLGGKGPPYAEPAWRGTLVSDQYSGYNPVLDPQGPARPCGRGLCLWPAQVR